MNAEVRGWGDVIVVAGALRDALTGSWSRRKVVRLSVIQMLFLPTECKSTLARMEVN